MREKDAPLLQQVGVAYRMGYRRFTMSADASMLPVVAADHGTVNTPDIWVNTLLDTVAEDASQVAVIPDTRFPNELAAVRASGGFVIRIERPDRPASGRDDTHISETALDGETFEFVVVNDGTKDALLQRLNPALRAIERLLEGRE